ncbi:hypothetical protein [Rheinheimera sp.]|uniref:hypothetical protein n=1 Tax=Rheinheimera sp. TaxID=1869214 RepID=UPI00404718AD
MLKMVHKYNAIPHLLAQSTSGPVLELFLCNGMFDPEVALGGHQPFYFDQLSAIYNHFTVLSSVCRATFMIDESSAYVGGATCGIYLEDDSTGGPTTFIAMSEQASAVTKAVADNDKVTITKYWNARQAYGGNTMDDNLLRGDVATDPQETMAFGVFCFGQLASYVTCRVDVEIEYTAVWTELKPITTS